MYSPPLPVGLAPEARQALIQERIAKIFEQVWAPADSPPEAPERARPSWDSGGQGYLTARRFVGPGARARPNYSVRPAPAPCRRWRLLRCCRSRRASVPARRCRTH